MAILDCYIRVSRISGREGDSFISPKLQLERCQAHAKLHGHEIANVVEEFDASGGDDSRPLWQEMLGRIESGEVGGVIVARLDRFSRSVTGALTALDRIEQAGGVFVSVGDHIDATSPTGRLVLNVLLAMAQWQREEAAAGFRAARVQAVRRGVHVTSRAPIGYEKQGRGQPLELADDATVALVREMFERRAKREPYATIVDDLNARGVQTSLGGEWTGRAVAQVLGNRVYLGEARSGDIVNGAAHPAIVDERLWTAAQGRPSDTPWRERKSLLAGMIRCANCRHALTGGGSVAYFCHGRHASGRCSRAASIRQERANAFVVEQFFGKLGELAGVADLADREIDRLRQRIVTAEAEIAAWSETVGVMDVGRDVFAAGLEQRVTAADVARRAYRDAVLNRPRHEDLPDEVTLRQVWPSLSVAEQREMLSAGIECIFLRSGRGAVEDRLHICWAGDRPDHLPRPANLSDIVPFVFPGDDDPVVLGVAALE